MIHWKGMIDGTSFGLITRYLVSPRSAIDYLLHVRDRDMLAELAHRIDLGFFPVEDRGQRLSAGMRAMVREGLVKISTRHPLAHLKRDAQIDASRVDGSAYCEVIYLPPFYLVHTPGLFEGEVIATHPPTQESDRTLPGQTRHCGSQHSKDRDQGHSH